MESGKRKRIMIACVTFETIKITEPVEHYETSIVHLLHYVRDKNSQSGKIYQQFYDEVSNQIETMNYTIIEHNSNVNSFPDMMRILTDILYKENNSEPLPDIFVNISAGSSEYVAAATIVSMMFPNAVPFSVRTKKYTVNVEEISRLYFKNNHPIGLTEEIYPPVIMPKISIPRPDERLVKALRVYVKSDQRAKTVISQLKETKLWIRESDKSTNAQKYDSVYYHRDFVDRWIEYGWVFKDAYLNRYNLTDEGRRILNTYYLE